MNSIVLDLERQERLRQGKSINLIASENYPSQGVLNRLYGPFVNKYAEGTPGKRFYAGCEIADKLEIHGQEIARKIFNCQYANLQPHSGACANWIAYFSCLEPGDTVVAMDLSAGGHLTHGFCKSLTSKVFNFVHFGVDQKSLEINYDEIEFLAIKHKAKMIVAGASSYPFLFNWKRLGEIAFKTGTILMADIAHTAGLVAAGVFENPFPHADIATLTTQKTLRGPRGGMILAKETFGPKIDRTVMPGFQGGPNMAAVAAKIIALEESQTESFKIYCRQILLNTKAFCQGFSALGIKPVGGGSENHLLLIETAKNFGLSGKKAQDLLTSFNIDVNRNHLPGDTTISSGIRLGMPAMTSRGMRESDCQEIATLIYKILSNSQQNKESLIQEASDIAIRLKL